MFVFRKIRGISFSQLNVEMLYDLITSDGCITRQSAIRQCRYLGSQHPTWNEDMTRLAGSIEQLTDGDWSSLVLEFSAVTSPAAISGNRRCDEPMTGPSLQTEVRS